ncbi:MAG: helix-turn-helix domain-containing protein [Planctomycetaceae bacterium]|nr:helix-turn-helix domain-containing protein [Planctomycetaceae bacterium]
MSPARKQPDSTTYSGRFAIRLRTLREKAGLTVQEVAEKLGVPFKSYYNWEASRSLPSIDKLPEIADVFGVKTRSILPEK